MIEDREPIAEGDYRYYQSKPGISELEVLKEQNAAMRAALERVLAHRKEDRDGNYVMWIGEGTFIQCEAAIKLHTTPKKAA